MEPAFYRGDLLLLTNDYSDPIRAGDVTVFKIDGRDIPIVHRVIKVHENSNMETHLASQSIYAISVWFSLKIAHQSAQPVAAWVFFASNVVSHDQFFRRNT